MHCAKITMQQLKENVLMKRGLFQNWELTN